MLFPFHARVVKSPKLYGTLDYHIRHVGKVAVAVSFTLAFSLSNAAPFTDNRVLY